MKKSARFLALCMAFCLACDSGTPPKLEPSRGVDTSTSPERAVPSHEHVPSGVDAKSTRPNPSRVLNTTANSKDVAHSSHKVLSIQGMDGEELEVVVLSPCWHEALVVGRRHPRDRTICRDEDSIPLRITREDGTVFDRKLHSKDFVLTPARYGDLLFEHLDSTLDIHELVAIQAAPISSRPGAPKRLQITGPHEVSPQVRFWLVPDASLGVRWHVLMGLPSSYKTIETVGHDCRVDHEAKCQRVSQPEPTDVVGWPSIRQDCEVESREECVAGDDEGTTSGSYWDSRDFSRYFRFNEVRRRYESTYNWSDRLMEGEPIVLSDSNGQQVSVAFLSRCWHDAYTEKSAADCERAKEPRFNLTWPDGYHQEVILEWPSPTWFEDHFDVAYFESEDLLWSIESRTLSVRKLSTGESVFVLQTSIDLEGTERHGGPVEGEVGSFSVESWWVPHRDKHTTGLSQLLAVKLAQNVSNQPLEDVRKCSKSSSWARQKMVCSIVDREADAAVKSWARVEVQRQCTITTSSCLIGERSETKQQEKHHYLWDADQFIESTEK